MQQQKALWEKVLLKIKELNLLDSVLERAGIYTAVEEDNKTYLLILGTNELLIKELRDLTLHFEIGTIEKIQPIGFKFSIYEVFD